MTRLEALFVPIQLFASYFDENKNSILIISLFSTAKGYVPYIPQTLSRSCADTV